MKDPTCIHPLAQRNRISGEIYFEKNGIEHKFASVINSMSGSRLTYFDHGAPTINDTKSWIQSVFKAIRKDKDATIITDIGDY
jgi:hypothetical protein